MRKYLVAVLLSLILLIAPAHAAHKATCFDGMGGGIQTDFSRFCTGIPAGSIEIQISGEYRGTSPASYILIDDVASLEVIYSNNNLPTTWTAFPATIPVNLARYVGDTGGFYIEIVGEVRNIKVEYQVFNFEWDAAPFYKQLVGGSNSLFWLINYAVIIAGIGAIIWRIIRLLRRNIKV